jgi:hypothetical protein
MTRKFKVNQIVRILEEDEKGINGYGRINAIRDGMYWVVNFNMPFSGTISRFYCEDELGDG